MTYPAVSTAKVDPVDASWRILQAGGEKPFTPRGLSRLKGNRCTCRDRDPDTKRGEGKPSLKLIVRTLAREIDTTMPEVLAESTKERQIGLTLAEALVGAELAPPSFAEADGAICVNGQVFFFRSAEEDTESSQEDVAPRVDPQPFCMEFSV